MRARTDHETEARIGALLRIGVLVAAAVVSVGAVLYLWRDGGTIPDYRVFRGEPPRLRSPAAILQGALALRPRAVIGLGLLILIATPVARVAFSVWVFAREGDRLYVAVTLLVLTILLYSLASGG